MSYVSLENSEPFLKCFEVMAEDKSCVVTDSVPPRVVSCGPFGRSKKL